MERDFKGIFIPKGIWLDENLGVLDKVILMEVDSLDSNEEGCFATNEYLADFCKCTETKISTSISKLIKLGYLEILKFDGRRRYLKSRLKNFEKQPLKNLKADFKKIKEINIDNNIDNNIKENNKKKKYFEDEKINEIFDEFLQMRKKLKAVNSDRAINMLINKLKEYDEETQYAMIEQSVINSWKGIFEIKNYKKKEDLPIWFNKEIKENVNEERKKLAEQLTQGTWES